MNIQEVIVLQKEKLRNQLHKRELALGEITFNNGHCQILSQSSLCFELIITNETNLASAESIEYRLDIMEDDMVFPRVNGESTGWDRNSYAFLLQVENETHLLDQRKKKKFCHPDLIFLMLTLNNKISYRSHRLKRKLRSRPLILKR